MKLTYCNYSTAPITALRVIVQYLGVVCLVWLGLFSSDVRAQFCWSLNSVQGASIAAQNFSAALDSLAPGTALSSSATAMTGEKFLSPLNPWASHCNDGDGRRMVYELTDEPLPGVNYQANGSNYFVFGSGVEGIGYAIEVRARKQNDVWGNWVPVNAQSVTLASGSNSDKFYVQTRVIAVSIGRLKSGSYAVPSQDISGKYVVYGTGSGKMQVSDALSWSIPSVTVATRTCKLTSGATNDVVLPTVVTTSFPDSIGAVSRSGATSFSMQLNCDRDVQVYATMTDASDPTNTSDILSATDQSTAGGVGIQVSRPNEPAPVRFGPDSSAKGNVNQWYVGESSASGGGVTLPLIAKYVRTAPKITAGTVQARSTITFSYQ
ncbi:fimbrial protein [Burkholderia territorii]|uniref:fimbrial protein n=1 Tax=Burkholderia territorii TaxID=1503055 RepID=UPI0018C758A9|nr:fimbrial protein [Burkholderia territorii]